jgi:prepilin-type N-terminal cleavage/methylation domain-containing protein
MRLNLRKDGYTLIEILIVVMIIGILLAIAVPSMFNASERARANACRANLRQIQAAKEQWALVNRRPGTAIAHMGVTLCPSFCSASQNALQVVPIR